MEYRLATFDDQKEIVNIFKSVIDKQNDAGIKQWDMEIYPTPDDIRKDIDTQEMYVGTINNQIAVVYTINKEIDDQFQYASWREGTNFLIVHRLCVALGFQNQHIGRETMNHIQEESRNYGIKSIRLEVFTQNLSAVSLIEKLGYQRCGEGEWTLGKYNFYELLLN